MDHVNLSLQASSKIATQGAKINCSMHHDPGELFRHLNVPANTKHSCMIAEVPEKFQVLIPEKCSNESSKGGKSKLSRNPVLNPKSEPVEPTPVLFEMLETGRCRLSLLSLLRLNLNLSNSSWERLNLLLGNQS